MRNRAATLLAFAVAFGAGVRAQEPAPVERTYLRWPHEAAGLSDAERMRLRESVFILNNFGLYQNGNTPDSVYFHDGLDVVLPNGTPIYAIVSGYVRSISGTVPYRQVIVEDAENPGWAWEYVHIDRVPFRVGEFVPDSAQVAVVSFQGVEHVHLNRVHLTENGRWDDPYAQTFVQAIDNFEFIDEEPPAIETPFRYFRNETDDELRNGLPTLVSGEIDIVAGMRDGGQYAHGRLPGISSYGDRLAPQRAEISIARAEEPDAVVWSNVAFDFTKLTLGWRRPLQLFDPDRVFTVFKYRPLVQTSPPGNYSKVLSYYVLTNRGNNDDEPRPIVPEDSLPSWNTAERDAGGRPRFPDGEYIVTVKAWDAKGNVATARDRVIVSNR